MTDWVRIYPPPDDPDEIARDLRALLSWDCPSFKAATELELAIAAALRAYGASQRNAGLDLAAANLDMRGEHWTADRIRALKSTPESKP